MALDIYFREDVSNTLASLDEANAMALDMAIALGANRRETTIARLAYQAALAHVGRAFGLSQTQIVVILSSCEERYK